MIKFLTEMFVSEFTSNENPALTLAFLLNTVTLIDLRLVVEIAKFLLNN